MLPFLNSSSAFGQHSNGFIVFHMHFFNLVTSEKVECVTSSEISLASGVPLIFECILMQYYKPCVTLNFTDVGLSVLRRFLGMPKSNSTKVCFMTVDHFFLLCFIIHDVSCHLDCLTALKICASD